MFIERLKAKGGSRNPIQQVSLFVGNTHQSKWNISKDPISARFGV